MGPEDAARHGVATLPMVVRIAGLPAETLAPFGVPDIESHSLAPMAQLAKGSGEARERLVEKLFEAVSDAPPEDRKRLLALKRDAFNGRSLERFCSDSEADQDDPVARHLDPSGRDLLQQIVARDARRTELEVELKRLFEERQLLERTALVAALDNAELRRGMALTSPLTVENLYRLERKEVSRWGKRERRLELSGLRFLCRAAVKTSPYSTLTRSALAVLTPGSEPQGSVSESGERAGQAPGAQLLGSDESWRRHARMRLKRFLPEGDLVLLSRWRPFVRDLSLALNDTLERIGEHQFQFLRPVFQAPKEGRLVTFKSIMLKAKLRHALLGKLAEGEIAMPMPYERFVGVVQQEGNGDRESAERFVRQLIGAGILSFQHRWPVNTLQVEQEIRRRLREIAESELEPSEAESAAALVESYDELLGHLEAFPASAEPVRTLRALDAEVDRSFRRAASAAGIEVDEQRIRQEAGNYYEDVHLTHGLEAGSVPAEGSWGACLRLEPTTAAAINEALRPLNRFNQLFHRRHEILATLGGFMAAEWPRRHEVPLIETFAAFQDHWRAFKKWRTRDMDRNFDELFDPLDLDPGQELLELRREVMRGVLKATVRTQAEGADDYEISPAALLEATDIIPAAYRPPCGPCAFLQPSNGQATQWVMNRLYEGTGRYASRFAAPMPAPMGERWTEAQRLRGPFILDGEPAALLDLWTANFDTLNLHGPQTDYVLALPGNHFDIDPSRIRRLSDLRVRFRPGVDSAPRIVDSTGQLLCPVYLGGTGVDFSPPIIEMLVHFGPGDLKTPGLVVPEEACPGGRYWPRLRSGPVILKRRLWQLETAELHQRTRHLGATDALLELNRWRFDNGLPNETFLVELIAEDRYKPQYVDFSSPLFLPILRRGLQEQSSLYFYEALPRPGDLPKDASGNSYTFEVQFESIRGDL